MKVMRFLMERRINTVLIGGQYSVYCAVVMTLVCRTVQNR